MIGGLQRALRPIKDAWFRRYRRAPRPKPGHLVLAWAHEKDQGPDLYYCWGDGCSGADGRLIEAAVGAPSLQLVELTHNGPLYDYGKSLAEELIERGYDITTLRFAIQKKAPNAD